MLSLQVVALLVLGGASMRALSDNLFWTENVVLPTLQVIPLLLTNGYLSFYNENELNALRKMSTFENDMAYHCPTDFYEEFPLQSFLHFYRLYYADKHSILNLWIESDGLLGPKRIVNFASEVKMLQLLAQRTVDFDKLPPASDDSDLSDDTLRNCNQQLRSWTTAALTIVENLITSVKGQSETIDACGANKLTSSDFGLLITDPIVQLWVDDYLEHSINAYLSGDVCNSASLAAASQPFEILRNSPSQWVGSDLDASDDTSPNATVVVVQRRIADEVSFEHCTVGRLARYSGGTLRPKSDFVTCSIIGRGVYILPGGVTDVAAEIEDLRGGGCHTSSQFACMTWKTDAGSSNASSEVETECFHRLDHLQTYSMLIVSTGFALSPALRPSLSSSSTARPRLLNIGLGGGSLHVALREFMPQLFVETVEIDVRAVQVFTDFFYGDRVVCEFQTLRRESTDSHDPSLDNAFVASYRRTSLFNKSVSDIGRETVNCSSKVTLANAWKYIPYLREQLQQKQNEASSKSIATDSNEGDVADHHLFDLIIVDTFDSAVTQWYDEKFLGISNVPFAQVGPVIASMHAILRPGQGILFFHLHKDGQFHDYVKQLVATFGRDQILLFDEGGRDAVIAAGRDVFVHQTVSNHNDVSLEGRVTHPCSVTREGRESTFLAEDTNEFTRAWNLPTAWRQLFRFALDCDWYDTLFPLEIEVFPV